MNVFYTLRYAKTGDVIPFYNDAARRFEHFYLKNWNPDAPEDQVVRGWHKLVTADNLHFEESPTGIQGGTGSVLRVGDTYHMFYCTFDFDTDPVAQWVRHAVSTDMEHWTDIPEEKFGPDGVNRYIYGWNPTRGENAWGFDPGKDLGLDYTSWNWGGSIVAHKLVQHADGTLAVLYVDRDLAFGFRMYNWSGRRLGFFVEDGGLTAADTSIAGLSGI